MMITLHPTYTLKVEVKDAPPDAGQYAGVVGGGVVGQAQAYQGLGRKYFVGGQTGCDEVLKAVREALLKAGVTGATVSFEKFEHRA